MPRMQRTKSDVRRSLFQEDPEEIRALKLRNIALEEKITILEQERQYRREQAQKLEQENLDAEHSIESLRKSFELLENKDLGSDLSNKILSSLIHQNLITGTNLKLRKQMNFDQNTISFLRAQVDVQQAHIKELGNIKSMHHEIKFMFERLQESQPDLSWISKIQKFVLDYIEQQDLSEQVQKLSRARQVFPEANLASRPEATCFDILESLSKIVDIIRPHALPGNDPKVLNASRIAYDKANKLLFEIVTLHKNAQVRIHEVDHQVMYTEWVASVSHKCSLLASQAQHVLAWQIMEDPTLEPFRDLVFDNGTVPGDVVMLDSLPETGEEEATYKALAAAYHKTECIAEYRLRPHLWPVIEQEFQLAAFIPDLWPFVKRQGPGIGIDRELLVEVDQALNKVVSDVGYVRELEFDMTRYMLGSRTLSRAMFLLVASKKEVLLPRN